MKINKQIKKIFTVRNIFKFFMILSAILALGFSIVLPIATYL